jgi:hypothetical protein
MPLSTRRRVLSFPTPTSSIVPPRPLARIARPRTMTRKALERLLLARRIYRRMRTYRATARTIASQRAIDEIRAFIDCLDPSKEDPTEMQNLLCIVQDFARTPSAAARVAVGAKPE